MSGTAGCLSISQISITGSVLSFVWIQFQPTKNWAVISAEFELILVKIPQLSLIDQSDKQTISRVRVWKMERCYNKGHFQVMDKDQPRYTCNFQWWKSLFKTSFFPSESFMEMFHNYREIGKDIQRRKGGRMAGRDFILWDIILYSCWLKSMKINTQDTYIYKFFLAIRNLRFIHVVENNKTQSFQQEHFPRNERWENCKINYWGGKEEKH